ncbi:hypothetical protein TSUD_74580 [Trifolium subterraneum]|nr:hypothetical protein TSUD_74580 [Trifolium subterraneum]
MFMIMMGVNNCPKHTIPPDVCFPAVFGRFSLQPTDQNSKYGPSRLIPLLTDITILLAVGVPLERKFRFARVGSLYLISGLGGSLASSLFYESSVTIGASGALVGLAGGTISKSFLEYWTLHLPVGCDLLIVVVSMPINVAITMFEHGDNFANLGGLIVGVLFGRVDCWSAIWVYHFYSTSGERIAFHCFVDHNSRWIDNWNGVDTKRGEFE